MATSGENDPNNLVDTIETILNETRREEPEINEGDTFRPFIFFGLRIPTIHRSGLYLHLFIVCLQYFFFFNTKIMLGHVLKYTFEDVFANDFSYPLLSTTAYLFIPFIVYFCDRQMIRRYYLVSFYLVIALLSSCFLLSLLLLKHFDTTGNNITNFSSLVNSTQSFEIPEKTLAVLSFVLFSISFVLSDTFTIAFGLDILHGTQLETLLLYFPLFYIARNIGATCSYLQYIRYFQHYYFAHCSVTTFVVFTAVFLHFAGRICGFFKDSALVANNFSFKKGIQLIIAALKLKFIERNRADFKSLMLYTARKNGYPNPKSQVNRTIALFKINIIFIILIPLFGSYQILYQLFPDQSKPLVFLPKPVSSTINDHNCIEKNILKTYWIINTLIIVVFAVIFEYFFNDIVFNAVRQDLPCWIRCVSRRLLFIRNTCLFGMRNKLHDYLTLVDPILKRVFWGLPFGLLCALCALIVEILRFKFTYPLDCKTSENKVFYRSHVPLIAQVPQYVLSALQETISAIGLLQYVYYLCSEHFQNSLRGYFFSLYYFYYGLAGFISSLAYFIMGEICHIECKNYTSYTYIIQQNQSSHNTTIFIGATNPFCFVFNSNCSNEQPYSWVVWVIAIILYSIMIPLFYWFSHHKHWKRVRDMRLHELTWNEVD